MISIALCELNCSSLNYVYRMSWAEFRLRLIAFNRSEQRDEYKLRRLSWITYIAPHQDPKKLKGMHEDRWWKIGDEATKPKVTEEHKEFYLSEMRKYLAKKNNGRS